MRTETDPLVDSRMRAAVAELQGMIRGQYPETTFDVWVGLGDDRDGVYVEAVVDAEDLTEVEDIYSERLVDLHVEDGLWVWVLPVRAGDRVRRATAVPPESVNVR